MSYQVLARKWRPRIFSELVGQEHVVTAISNALDNDRLHHAYLFTGTRGVGKTTIARIFSKSLNCEEGQSATPCGKCYTCTEIEQGNYVDLLEIDAASRTKVEDTRELLDNVQYKPTRGRYKVYLIDEVHMLSKHSFNALLKTLEEPPPHVKFLLATTDPQKLPITILSRCLQFNLKALSREQISGQLTHILNEEQIAFEPPAIALLARAAQGSMRDALSLTDQAIAQGDNQVLSEVVTDMLGLMDRHQILKLLHSVIKKQPETMMNIINSMAEQSPDYSQVLAELSSLLHQVALTQWIPDVCKLETTSAKAIYQLAKTISAEQVQLYYQIVLQGRKDLPFALDGRSGLEMTLIRMMSFAPVPSQEDNQPVIQEGGNPPPSVPQLSPVSDTSEQPSSSHMPSSFEPQRDSDVHDQGEDSMEELNRQQVEIEHQAEDYRQQSTDETLGSSVDIVEQHVPEVPQQESAPVEPSTGQATSIEHMLALRQQLKKGRTEADESPGKKPSKHTESAAERVKRLSQADRSLIKTEQDSDTQVNREPEKPDNQGVSEQSIKAGDDADKEISGTPPPWVLEDIASTSVATEDKPQVDSEAETPALSNEKDVTATNAENVVDESYSETLPVVGSDDRHETLSPYLADGKKLLRGRQIDSWSHLVARLGLVGLTKQIVLNSAFSKANGKVTLELDRTQDHLLKDSAVAQLKQALSAALEEDIELEIVLGEPVQTPLTLQARIDAMRQEHARGVVRSDEIFTLLRESFSATVLEDTIRPRE
ncbi:DNA polymerase III subunit gamma/tau [Alteromonas sp. C1M14]|uniref:DNA polymerase III subunit gamma/tau n=1 Tax=Alteromonas sp. C1M14 TaxID=2841567 RepID=UPI001C08C233|nr:DNA polymerase III subunit gamma/tau [Alteromonas sp. C1M14]MBU2979816.1 DNA polymerase III subunit gamma/tau [Alteromonas sp. C1M14]